jgi:hypothetical protein
MDDERNLGVTEARFALTILTCLLVAIGYIALLRLGGTKDNLEDINLEAAPPPIIAGPAIPLEEQPHVLLIEKPEDVRTEPASLANRPISRQQPPEPKRR